MSSLPPQRSSPSQGQSSASSEASSEQPSQSEQQQRPERRGSLSRSIASVDSQTVFLNTPTDSVHLQTSESTSTRHEQTEEPQKCWICFADETEDSPTSSRWRSPCSCALTAHEACLLDWVADLEAPSSRKRSSVKIQCPQCKSDILIARPKNYLVEGVKYLDRAVSKTVVPGIILTLVGSLYTGAAMHGFTTVYLVFGRRDFETLLGNPERLSAKWLVGFPLIPFALILSRTTLGDGILPALPAIFFASTIPMNNYGFLRERPEMWPPSAGMTIAMLPYVRVAYNELYKRIFAEREKRWVREVQPRAGENPEENAGHDHNHDHDEAELAIGWDFQVELFEDGANEDQAAPQQRHRRREPRRAEGQNPPPAADEGEAGEGNNAEGQQENQAANRQANRRQAQNRNHNLVVTTSRIADAIMGALCFPAVASAVGELLRLGLPRSWTEASYLQRPSLLRTKWGRSIIGGCLFVVMKDTLILYSKYRTAKDHRFRKIMNYDKATGKHVA